MKKGSRRIRGGRPLATVILLVLAFALMPGAFAAGEPGDDPQPTGGEPPVAASQAATDAVADPLAPESVDDTDASAQGSGAGPEQMVGVLQAEPRLHPDAPLFGTGNRCVFADVRYQDGARDHFVYCAEKRPKEVTRVEVPVLLAERLQVECKDDWVGGDLGGRQLRSFEVISYQDFAGGRIDRECSGAIPDLTGVPVFGTGVDCRYADFRYTDGHRDHWIVCGTGHDVTPQHIPIIHVRELHLSCSDAFTGGRFQKGDPQGVEDGLEHFVQSWHITRFRDITTGEIRRQCGRVEIPEAPAITLVKTATSWTHLGVGGVVTYEFLVSNTGDVTLEQLTLVDDLIGTLTSEIAVSSLAAGTSTTVTATYTITQADVDAGQVVNEAIATGTSPGGVTVEDRDEETVPIDQAPGISLEKTGVERARVGDVVTYEFTVTNTGALTLFDVTLTDPLLGGALTLDRTTLAPGEDALASATYAVTPADGDRGFRDNLATARGRDSAGREVVATDDHIFTVLPALRPAIRLIKHSEDVARFVGQRITYAFAITNTGNVPLKELELRDRFYETAEDRLTWEGGVIPGSEVDLTPNLEAAQPSRTLAVGETIVVFWQYVVTDADLDRGGIFNRAQVRARQDLDALGGG